MNLATLAQLSANLDPAVIAAIVSAVAAIITTVLLILNNIATYNKQKKDADNKDKLNQQDSFRDDLIQHVAVQDERLDKALKRIDALQEVIEGLRETNAHLQQDKWEKEQIILELKIKINKMNQILSKRYSEVKDV